MRRLVYHVSVTQDGFIAGPGGEFDFFAMNDDLAETLNARFPETIPTDLRGALGITEDNKVFDTVLMGRKTYEVGLPHGIVSPYRQLRQYVFSTTLDELPGPDIELVGGTRSRRRASSRPKTAWTSGCAAAGRSPAPCTTRSTP